MKTLMIMKRKYRLSITVRRNLRKKKLGERLDMKNEKDKNKYTKQIDDKKKIKIKQFCQSTTTYIERICVFIIKLASTQVLCKWF